MITRSGKWHEDRGAATVAVVGVIAALATVMLAALLVAGAVIASHQARLAADLAALAGATRLQGGAGVGAACSVADTVARANHGRLVGCRVAGTAVEVTVQVRADRWPTPAVARARAGPARDVAGP